MDNMQPFPSFTVQTADPQQGFQQGFPQDPGQGFQQGFPLDPQQGFQPNFPQDPQQGFQPGFQPGFPQDPQQGFQPEYPQTSDVGAPGSPEETASAVDGIDFVGGIDAAPAAGYDAFPYDGFAYAYEQGYAMDTGYPMLTNEEQLAAFLQERADSRWKASPLLVFVLMLVFFPAGLFMMLFFTRWGAYPKILITLFVLAAALAVYEILVAKSVIALPSVISAISGLLRELF